MAQKPALLPQQQIYKNQSKLWVNIQIDTEQAPPKVTVAA